MPIVADYQAKPEAVGEILVKVNLAFHTQQILI